MLEVSQQRPPAAADITWPTKESIKDSQNVFKKLQTTVFSHTDRLWKQDSCIWTSAANQELKLKITVSSYCGEVGHRGLAATLSILRESFLWSAMDSDVKTFVKSCLHCVLSRSGQFILRLLGHALHSINPNGVIHIDYLYMGRRVGGRK